jgi:hypothetical protein
MPVQYIVMKPFSPGGTLGWVLLLAACGGPLRPVYRPVLPALPPAWMELLGSPRWRLEWIDQEGVLRQWEGPGGEFPKLSLPEEWTSPVLAWPFWPAWELPPGTMRPAGALFPWDVSGGRLLLSWRGGVDAVFWKHLAGAPSDHPPWHFDWPRFRELWANGNVPEEIRRDPWLADWKEIGRKTLASGFDRRRIVSRPVVDVVIPGFGGRWIGSSPFAVPLEVPPEGPLRLKAAAAVDAWISAQGQLKCSRDGWVWIPRR